MALNPPRCELLAGPNTLQLTLMFPPWADRPVGFWARTALPCSISNPPVRTKSLAVLARPPLRGPCTSRHVLANGRGMGESEGRNSAEESVARKGR